MEANRRSPFGMLLRQFREASGLSQEQLAEHARLSVRGISDLERGLRTTPRPVTVHMLAEGLGLNTIQRSELLFARKSSQHPRPKECANGPPGLPMTTTSFIGRAEEVEEIIRLLVTGGVRLLTLTGPGGVGKTRIAIEVAYQLVNRFANGVIFVDLSPIRKPEMVVAAIADRLEVLAQREVEIRDTLALSLQDRSLLMVLDNLEQVIHAATDVAWLLAACPGLTIIVTSRILLRVAAEHVMPIEPMTLPVGDDVGSLEQSEAVALFVARARAADHSFSLDNETAADVAAVVIRLQGMPLAIELAATRIRFWSISQLLQRLQSQLPVLSVGARDAPLRHRTMRDTIAWSYELMSTVEQDVFRSLSIFPEGCTLETVIGMLGVESRFSEAEAIDALSLLVDCSILRRRLGSDGRMRYRMMQPVREFGLEQLEATGEESLARLAAHDAWCVPLARRIERGIAQPDAVPRLAQTAAEFQNVREHIAWLMQHNHFQEALDISGSVAPYRALRGHFAECKRELQALLVHPCNQVTNRTRVKAQIWLGIINLNQADTTRALVELQIGLALARELDDQRMAALALLSSSVALLITGQLDRAETSIEDGMSIARTIGDDFGMARGAWNLGLILDQRGEHAHAYQQIEESVEANLSIGNLWDVASCKLHLASMDIRAGELHKAEALILDAQQIFTELEDKRDIPSVYLRLADIARMRGDLGEAEIRLEQALAISRDIGNMLDMAHCYLRLARIARHRGDVVASHSLTCSAIHWYERCGSVVDAVECLDNLANIASVSGEFTRAAWCIGAVDSVLAQRGMSRIELVTGEHETRVAWGISVLGQEEWEMHHARGRSMPPDAILAEVKFWLSCRISEAKVISATGHSQPGHAVDGRYKVSTHSPGDSLLTQPMPYAQIPAGAGQSACLS